MANTKKAAVSEVTGLEDKYEYKTAAQALEPHTEKVESLHAYENYVPALENYEDREDVEPLEARRARESGTSFGDAQFARDEPSQNPFGGVVTSTQVTDREDAKDAKSVQDDKK
jgi:hypothetical protein